MAGFTPTERRIFECFAAMLDYPQPGLVETIRDCESLIEADHPAAAAALREFRAIVSTTALSRLEEVYIGTFELDATLHPYVGYHLFGESYKRSVFLLGLKERFRADGFTAEPELPDHLAVLLRFFAVTSHRGAAEELIDEALLPVFSQIMGSADESADPGDAEQMERQTGRQIYRRVLRALQDVLQSDRPAVSYQPLAVTPGHLVAVES